MNKSTYTVNSDQTWTGLRALRLAILVAGPLFTMYINGLLTAGRFAMESSSLKTLAVVLWSPLFLSVPALLLQRERDNALTSESNSILRSVKLLPHLLSRKSAVRIEMWVSVGLWCVMVLNYRDAVSEVVGRVLG